MCQNRRPEAFLYFSAKKNLRHRFSSSRKKCFFSVNTICFTCQWFHAQTYPPLCRRMTLAMTSSRAPSKEERIKHGVFATSFCLPMARIQIDLCTSSTGCAGDYIVNATRAAPPVSIQFVPFFSNVFNYKTRAATESFLVARQRKEQVERGPISASWKVNPPPSVSDDCCIGDGMGPWCFQAFRQNVFGVFWKLFIMYRSSRFQKGRSIPFLDLLISASTAYQHSSIVLSTAYQHPINTVSTSYRHRINIVSTSWAYTYIQALLVPQRDI